MFGSMPPDSTIIAGGNIDIILSYTMMTADIFLNG